MKLTPCRHSPHVATTMGVGREGQEGALAPFPPWPAKKCFLTLKKKKMVCFKAFLGK